MNSFLFCFFVVTLAICSHFPILVYAIPSKLDEVCNKLVHIDKVVTPDLCHSVFQRDPRSRTTADYHALGLILANITTKATMEATAGMKHVVFHTHTLMNKEQIEAARACVYHYEDAIPSLQATIKSLRTKNYKLAQNALIVATFANSKCVDEVMFDDDDNMIGRYIWKFRTFFPEAICVLDAMTQLLVNTYAAH